MADRKTSGFGIGLVIGAVGGALAGLFLAPKSGKALRKDAKKKYDELTKLMKEKKVDKKVKEVFGKVTKETVKIYEDVKKDIVTGLSELEKIDKPAYVKKVEEAVGKMKSPISKQSADAAKKLKDSLTKDWSKLEKSLKKPN